MKTASRALLMASVVLFLLCCSPHHYPSVTVRPASCSHDIQFATTDNFGALLQFADKMHKPVFISFYSPWIESCNRMEQTVFTQNTLAAYYNLNFINYKVNISGPPDQQQLADLYNVTLFPSLLFVDGKGKVMMRHEGPATASQMLDMGMYLHKAVEKEMISMSSN